MRKPSAAAGSKTPAKPHNEETVDLEVLPEFLVWELTPILEASTVTYVVGMFGTDIDHLPNQLRHNKAALRKLRLALKLVRFLEPSLTPAQIRAWFRGGELLIPDSPADKIRTGLTPKVQAMLWAAAARHVRKLAAYYPV